MEELKNKIQETVNAANYLIKNQFYREAAANFWVAVRSSIFYHLLQSNINYSTTKEALKEIILKYADSKLSDQIIFVETIGTLSEWDEFFIITKEQILDLRNICIEIILKFISIDICQIDSEGEYEFELLQQEVKRHMEDAKYSMSTQYAAAIRNENQYNTFLFLGFFITLFGISCFLCSLNNYLCFCKDWIGQFITLFGACVTLWPLIKDYSGKAVHHRQSANEYNSIFKKCNNWKSDFPYKDSLYKAKQDILSIRTTINIINHLAPKTEDIDYKKGKESILSGSYTYDSLDIQKNKRYLFKKEAEIRRGDFILKEQNSPEAIQLLKAKSIAYTCSKKYSYIDTLIAFISLIFYIYHVSTGDVRMLDIYRIIPFIGSYAIIFVVYKIQREKTLTGARIQEKFDTKVFDLHQNKILVPAYPSIEVISEHSAKYKKNDPSNWYMEYLKLDNYPLPIAILRCQLANLLWDKSQRKALKTTLRILLASITICFIIISYVNNYPIQECVKSLIIISPLFIYLIKNIFTQTEMIKNKTATDEYIFDLLNKCYEEKYIPTETELRSIQDSIYNQRTQIQSAISNVWYRMRKKATEKHLKQVFNNLK
jgi:hypothetical protein